MRTLKSGRKETAGYFNPLPLSPSCRFSDACAPNLLYINLCPDSCLQHIFHLTGLNAKGHRHLFLKCLFYQQHHLRILRRELLAFSPSAFFPLIQFFCNSDQILIILGIVSRLIFLGALLLILNLKRLNIPDSSRK